MPGRRFPLRDPALAGRLPCLQEQSGDYGEIIYAAPVPGEPLYAVGLAGEDAEVPLDADREAGVARLVSRIAAYVEEALPGLDPEPAEVRLCLATTLPEGDDAFRICAERLGARAGRTTTCSSSRPCSDAELAARRAPLASGDRQRRSRPSHAQSARAGRQAFPNSGTTSRRRA